MALTERKEIGSMNVLPMGQIQVRKDTIIEKEDVILQKINDLEDKIDKLSKN